MTAFQREILEAIAIPNAVIWPRVCEGVSQYATGADGRVHFQAPIDDAFALFDLKYIDAHGVITEAGRAFLTDGDRT